MNRAILKTIMKSKCFHLFSFNTHKNDVSIKQFRFFQFQFNALKTKVVINKDTRNKSVSKLPDSLTHPVFSVSRWLCKNLTRKSPSDFEFLICLIGEMISKKDSIQESRFCSRKVGADATFLGKL
jgi:hypothetical protein